MIFLILLFALGLRLVSINQSLWLDEATSALVARNMSFSQILTNFSPGDFHPPLYYLLLKIWASLFETTEITIRSLSVLAGLATVGLVFLIAKKLCKDRNCPEIAALMLATSGLHIYYSQEARMYALSTLFVSLAFYFFLGIIEKGRVWQWLGFSASLVLIGFCDYLPLLIIPVFWLWGLLGKKDFSWWKKFLLAHLLLGLLCLVWLPVFYQQFSGGVGVKEAVPLWWQTLGRTTAKEIILVPTKFILGRISLVNKKLYALLVAGIGLVFGYLLFRAAKIIFSRRRKGFYLGLWLVLPIAISGILGCWLPVFSYFRLLFVLPAFYLLLSLGVSSLKKNWLQAAFVFVIGVNLLSTGIYLFNPTFHREDWRGLVNFITKESKGKENLILFVADSQMEAYRFYSQDGKISGPEGLRGNLEQIWLMRYVQPIFDPEDKLKSRVEGLGYRKTIELDFNGPVVWKYEK